MISTDTICTRLPFAQQHYVQIMNANLWDSSNLRKWAVQSFVTRYNKTLYLFTAGGSVYSDFVITWKSK